MPLTQIASQMNMLQSGLASAERVFEFLDAPEETADQPTGAEPTRRPQHHRASRSGARLLPLEPDKPLIEDFTLKVAPGRTGRDRRSLPAPARRPSSICSFAFTRSTRDVFCSTAPTIVGSAVRTCVAPSAWFFRTLALRRNDPGQPRLRQGGRDRRGDRRCSQNRLRRPLRPNAPDGYETLLDEDASNISSGQKQLLTIARALLANPSILILDEATSNVDTRTEVIIQQAMARLRQGRTSFIIAHRLSTIRDADTIIVMDGGRIVEQGRHAELLDRHGLYHSLYNNQFTRSRRVRRLRSRPAGGVAGRESEAEGGRFELPTRRMTGNGFRDQARRMRLMAAVQGLLRYWASARDRLCDCPGLIGGCLTRCLPLLTREPPGQCCLMEEHVLWHVGR